MFRLLTLIIASLQCIEGQCIHLKQDQTIFKPQFLVTLVLFRYHSPFSSRFVFLKFWSGNREKGRLLQVASPTDFLQQQVSRTNVWEPWQAPGAHHSNHSPASALPSLQGEPGPGLHSRVEGREGKAPSHGVTLGSGVIRVLHNRMCRRVDQPSSTGVCSGRLPRYWFLFVGGCLLFLIASSPVATPVLADKCWVDCKYCSSEIRISVFIRFTNFVCMLWLS